MVEGAIDAIAALEAHCKLMQGWCDQEGSHDSGLMSVTLGTLIRLETVSRVARESLESGRPIDWGEGDAAAYLDGGSLDEPRLV